jgi:hypothetical protein
MESSRSKSISKPTDHQNSYTNNSNYNVRYTNSHFKLDLYEQLSKIDFNLGSRKYELRYEGEKKENVRCGNGRL